MSGPDTRSPDTMETECAILVHTRDVVQPRFIGVGFNVCHHVFPASMKDLEEVIYKRWRELSPSFARVGHDRETDWDRAMLDQVTEHLLRMQETGTEVYMVPWSPRDTQPGEERRAYARDALDKIEYLIREKGLDNIKYYCLSNELSLKDWADLTRDMPKFRDYHQALHDEIQARHLDIRLLASDASPTNYWWTIEWAAQNMDEITGIYGGHHYFNAHALDDESFYPWFLEKLQWGVGVAKGRGKDFILGEFGCKQDGRTIDGVLRDVCIHFDTPQEPVVSIQLAEAMIASLNAGVCALGYWTFMDLPDESSPNRLNKWGTFKCSGEDRSARPHYYAYGLLTRYFRGPATVLRVETGDPRLRAAAAQHHDKQTWSIVLVNRNPEEVPVEVKLDGEPLSAVFRKYVYDPDNIPQHPFGDLPEPAGTVSMENGSLTDTAGSGTLTVYTTAYKDEPPAPVKGVKIQRTPEGKDLLTWDPNTEPDLCYYRVYRSPVPGFTPGMDTQIGSTIASEFAADAESPYHYKVVAVDQSGNAGISR